MYFYISTSDFSKYRPILHGPVLFLSESTLEPILNISVEQGPPTGQPAGEIQLTNQSMFGPQSL